MLAWSRESKSPLWDQGRWGGCNDSSAFTSCNTVMVTVMGNRPRSWSWSGELKSPPLSLHFLHDQLFGHEVMIFIVMDIVMFSVSVYAVLRSCTVHFS
jgi:hypothetical protein